MNDPRILLSQDLGAFTHTWWAGGGDEHFERGWEGVVVVDGRERSFRHGIGERGAYGRPRARSVTWLDDRPIVEGVGEDDYETSRCLLSLVKKSNKRLARTIDELPPGYGDLPLVDHRAEINAPRSRRGLAVKLPEDDVRSWVALALLRERTLMAVLDETTSGKPGKEPNAATEPPAEVVVPAHPSLGLQIATELEAGLDLEAVRRYLRIYERETGYDASLSELRRSTGASVDPANEEQVVRLIKWLRAWGCRHLRRSDEPKTALLVSAWARSWLSALPDPSVSLIDMDSRAIASAAAAFGALSEGAAAFRARRSGDVVVRFGPTAAAKALYAIRPSVFPPWDDPIRIALGFSGNDAGYSGYLRLVASALTGLGQRAGLRVDELPGALGRPESTPPKLIDEYLWVRISRGRQVEQ
jgi:hypothetical protein